MEDKEKIEVMKKLDNLSDEKLYVGEIHFKLTEEDVFQLFSVIGTVSKCILVPNFYNGKHRGFGFVEYESSYNSKIAIDKLNNFNLMGRRIQVGKPENYNYTLPNFEKAKVKDQKIRGNEQGFRLMQKLARRDTKESRCIVLFNLCDSKDVNKDLELEVLEECKKYGKVEKLVIYQEKTSEESEDVIVKIYILFSNTDESFDAQYSFNNRYFDGRLVTCEFYNEEDFLNKKY
jgi:hypothetical protein